MGRGGALESVPEPLAGELVRGLDEIARGWSSREVEGRAGGKGKGKKGEGEGEMGKGEGGEREVGESISTAGREIAGEGAGADIGGRPEGSVLDEDGGSAVFLGALLDGFFLFTYASLLMSNTRLMRKFAAEGPTLRCSLPRPSQQCPGSPTRCAPSLSIHPRLARSYEGEARYDTEQRIVFLRAKHCWFRF